MYDNTAKTFWISFLTSLFVSLIVVFIMILFVVPNIGFLSNEQPDNKIEVPQLEGLNIDKAKIIAMNKGLPVFIESEKVSDEKKGTILSQSPMTGAEVDENTVINVIISAGPAIEEEPVVEKEEEAEEIKTVILSHYAGLNIDDVQRDIISKGLKIGNVEYTENDKYPADAVIRTMPESGSEIAEGSSINIYVSKGVGSITVPDVYRSSRSSAISKIKNAGLYVEQTYYTTNIEYPFDIVIRQQPKAGAKVKKGSGVKIWLNVEGR